MCGVGDELFRSLLLIIRHCEKAGGRRGNPRSIGRKRLQCSWIASAVAKTMADTSPLHGSQ